jgi:peptide/nickel transport system substrate-binding protein
VLAACVLVTASAQPQALSRYGGTLVVGMSQGDVQTLDPTLNRMPVSNNQVFSVICEQLYRTNRKLDLVPQLAASLPELSKDKLTYTVQLRQGIRFNDGTPFNAHAVVTTIERYRTFPASSQESKYTAVDSVTAPGPYTVVFRMKARDSALFYNPIWILSPTQIAKVGAGFAAAPVCVGPFMFDGRVVGDRITVVKSPFYYDQKNVFLDKIVFKPITDANAGVAALKAGDVQVFSNVPTTDLESVQKTDGLKTIQGYQLGWVGIQINIGNQNGAGIPPYANKGTPLAKSAKLRQAFEEAIDRNTLNRVVYGGLYQVTCTPIPPANVRWYESTKVPCTPYNPKHARQLVAESGFSNPTVHLLVGNSPEALRRAQVVQEQAGAVGFDVVIDSVDAPTTATLRTTGQFDAFFGGFAPGGPDPISTIRLATEDSANYPGYSNPRLDLILRNGLKATTPQARSTLYRVAQQIIQADRPYIPFFNALNVAAFSADVAGVEMNTEGVVNVAHARFK